MNDKKNKKHWTENKEAHQAAYLMAKEKKTRKEVLQQLDETRPKRRKRARNVGEQVTRVDVSPVTKWLNAAKELEIYFERPEIDLPDDILREVRASLYDPERLMILREFARQNRRFNNRRSISELHVVTNMIEEGEDFAIQLRGFGRAVATRTAELIGEPIVGGAESKCIGVGRGRQLRAVVDALLSNCRHSFPGNVGRVFAMWGEAWGPKANDGEVHSEIDPYSSSSNIISRDLARYCNPDDPSTHYPVEGFPTALPKQFQLEAQQNQLLKDYFRRMGFSSWDVVFGRRNFSDERRSKKVSLVSRADTMLCAIGSKESPGRFLAPDYLKYILGKARGEKFLRLICGDVGGVFIPNNAKEMSVQDCSFVYSMRRVWTGVRAIDLAQCVARGIANGTNGVVAYASYRDGAAKVCLEAIRHGLVSRLICDEMIASELHGLAEGELGKMKSPSLVEEA